MNKILYSSHTTLVSYESDDNTPMIIQHLCNADRNTIFALEVRREGGAGGGGGGKEQMPDR